MHSKQPQPVPVLSNNHSTSQNRVWAALHQIPKEGRDAPGLVRKQQRKVSLPSLRICPQSL